MKKIFSCMLVAAMVLLAFGFTPTYAAASKSINVVIDGKVQSFDKQPVTISGSVLVPMRSIFQALGASVNWNNKTRSIIANKGDTKVELTIDSARAKKNGNSLVLTSPPKIVSGATMVPLRFVGESLDCTVEWDGQTRTVYIDSKQTNDAHTDSSVTSSTLPSVSQINPSQTSELSTKQIAQLNDSKVVLVQLNNALGSAVSVGNGVFLTNYHVIDGETSGYIVDLKGNKYEIGGVVAYDKDLDLALIKLKDLTGNWSSVDIGNPAELTKGDKVVAIGSPLGFQNTVSEGVVSNFMTDKGVDYIQTSAPIDHGSSGGGLFNTRGQLVGITTFMIKDNTADLNFAVSIKEAESLLNGIKGKSFSQMSTSSLSSVSQAEQPANQSSTSSTSASEAASSIESALNDAATYIPTSVGNLSLGDWQTKVDDDGTILVANTMPVDSYATYLQYYDQIESEVHDWADQVIGQAIAKHYGDHKIYIGVLFTGEFDTYPSSFESSEITSTSDGYEVTHAFILVSIDGKVDTLVRP
ncbi:stalk domain-containing protein [Paenibacillus sediminis]|uniref:S1-C subfamily serine protease n=1 Tax=Paenibacillus sediminis TaxID=664909 RepID=A0ABS4GZH4_9BACL|nr:stalk domain-containing protein [Paenibacillus sediminis]MBP1935678.1 S1-C subfamily serine protease [Paenibacillus sediminis]